MQNCMLDDVRIVVATDSSAILGIGDQGWGGLSIAIGKLALYTVAGGVSPYRSLPIGLDVGTDRQDLLDSPSYLGLRQKRLRGAEYLALTDQVVDAIHARWPRAVDPVGGPVEGHGVRRARAVPQAAPVVQRRHPGNGRGGARRASWARARCAAGSCATRSSSSTARAPAARASPGRSSRGWSARASRSTRRAPRVLVLDSKGLLVEGRAMEDYKRAYAQPRARLAGWGDGRLRPGADDREGQGHRARSGLSGQPSTFTEPMVRAMCANVERPVIFPLSNPTSACEATPEDLLAWSHGRAIVATGSPFAPVRVGDRDQAIGQGNNAFIFPGLGFGAILAEASEITDGMVLGRRTRWPSTWPRSTSRRASSIRRSRR